MYLVAIDACSEDKANLLWNACGVEAGRLEFIETISVTYAYPSVASVASPRPLLLFHAFF